VSDRPYRYSPLPQRPKLEWPNGTRLALYVTLNLEHYERGKPAIALFQGTTSFEPDPLNEGWRDYGPRVGVWRLIDIFDRLQMAVTASINSDVCNEYPEIVAAGVERGWAWVAHGKNNTTLQVGMDEQTERDYLREVVETIEQATGARPRGWLSPVLTETPNTPRLLRELGLTYLLDWSHDEQPAPLDAGVAPMITLPYASELNDIQRSYSTITRDRSSARRSSMPWTRCWRTRSGPALSSASASTRSWSPNLIGSRTSSALSSTCSRRKGCGRPPPMRSRTHT
jgi:allantoinase